MAQVKIQAEDILLVNAIAGEFDYDKNSKMAGQKYRRFSYGGKVFISNDPTFFVDLSNGNIHTISIDADDAGQLSMTGYISFTKMQGLKRNQVILDSITVENYKVVALTPSNELIS